MTKTIQSKSFAVLVHELRSARIASGLTQREFAKVLSCSHVTIAKIETGQRRVDVVEMIGLARALDLDPYDLLSKIIVGADDSDFRHFLR